jgi:hypothetical protein
MKTIRALIGLVFIVAVIYGCWTVIPPYFAHYKFEDVVAEEARLSTYSSRSENEIREAVFRKAQDLDIPLTREQIKVQREGQGVNISVEYRVHLDIPTYPVDLNFHAASKNRAY